MSYTDDVSQVSVIHMIGVNDLISGVMMALCFFFFITFSMSVFRSQQYLMRIYCEQSFVQ